MAIAFFSTWTTYGTWLPGDVRGWWSHGKGLQLPDLSRSFAAALRMTEHAIVLDEPQRRLVEDVIIRHCAVRSWTLHAVNCRSNHVHVVVSALGEPLVRPREQFKAWCTRRLKERYGAGRSNWWTDRGWDEYIDDEPFLTQAIHYVRFEQDMGSDAVP